MPHIHRANCCCNKTTSNPPPTTSGKCCACGDCCYPWANATGGGAGSADGTLTNMEMKFFSINLDAGLMDNSCNAGHRALEAVEAGEVVHLESNHRLFPDPIVMKQGGGGCGTFMGIARVALPEFGNPEGADDGGNAYFADAGITVSLMCGESSDQKKGKWKIAVWDPEVAGARFVFPRNPGDPFADWRPGVPAQEKGVGPDWCDAESAYPPTGLESLDSDHNCKEAKWDVTFCAGGNATARASFFLLKADFAVTNNPCCRDTEESPPDACVRSGVAIPFADYNEDGTCP